MYEDEALIIRVSGIISPKLAKCKLVYIIAVGINGNPYSLDRKCEGSCKDYYRESLQGATSSRTPTKEILSTKIVDLEKAWKNIGGLQPTIRKGL